MAVHIIQKATTLDNIGRYVPRICIALDNKQAKNQSHMIEVEGMINKQHISILIDSGASHSYINPNIVEKINLARS